MTTDRGAVNPPTGSEKSIFEWPTWEIIMAFFIFASVLAVWLDYATHGPAAKQAESQLTTFYGSLPKPLFATQTEISTSYKPGAAFLSATCETSASQKRVEEFYNRVFRNRHWQVREDEFLDTLGHRWARLVFSQSGKYMLEVTWTEVPVT